MYVPNEPSGYSRELLGIRPEDWNEGRQPRTVQEALDAIPEMDVETPDIPAWRVAEEYEQFSNYEAYHRFTEYIRNRREEYEAELDLSRRQRTVVGLDTEIEMLPDLPPAIPDPQELRNVANQMFLDEAMQPITSTVDGVMSLVSSGYDWTIATIREMEEANIRRQKDKEIADEFMTQVLLNQENEMSFINAWMRGGDRLYDSLISQGYEPSVANEILMQQMLVFKQTFEQVESNIVSEYSQRRGEEMLAPSDNVDPTFVELLDQLPPEEREEAARMASERYNAEVQLALQAAGMDILGNPIQPEDDQYDQYNAWGYVQEEYERISVDGPLRESEITRLANHIRKQSDLPALRDDYVVRMSSRFMGQDFETVDDVFQFINNLPEDMPNQSKAFLLSTATKIFKGADRFVAESNSESLGMIADLTNLEANITSTSNTGPEPVGRTLFGAYSSNSKLINGILKGDPSAIRFLQVTEQYWENAIGLRDAEGNPISKQFFGYTPMETANGVMMVPNGTVNLTSEQAIPGTENNPNMAPLRITMAFPAVETRAFLRAAMQASQVTPVEGNRSPVLETIAGFTRETFRALALLESGQSLSELLGLEEGSEELAAAEQGMMLAVVNNLAVVSDILYTANNNEGWGAVMRDNLGVDGREYEHLIGFSNYWLGSLAEGGGYTGIDAAREAILSGEITPEEAYSPLVSMDGRLAGVLSATLSDEVFARQRAGSAFPGAANEVFTAGSDASIMAGSIESLSQSDLNRSTTYENFMKSNGVTADKDENTGILKIDKSPRTDAQEVLSYYRPSNLNLAGNQYVQFRDNLNSLQIRLDDENATATLYALLRDHSELVPTDWLRYVYEEHSNKTESEIMLMTNEEVREETLKVLGQNAGKRENSIPNPKTSMVYQNLTGRVYDNGNWEGGQSRGVPATRTNHVSALVLQRYFALRGATGNPDTAYQAIVWDRLQRRREGERFSSPGGNPMINIEISPTEIITLSNLLKGRQRQANPPAPGTTNKPATLGPSVGFNTSYEEYHNTIRNGGVISPFATAGNMITLNPNYVAAMAMGNVQEGFGRRNIAEFDNRTPFSMIDHVEILETGVIDSARKTIEILRASDATVDGIASFGTEMNMPSEYAQFYFNWNPMVGNEVPNTYGDISTAGTGGAPLVHFYNENPDVLNSILLDNLSYDSTIGNPHNRGNRMEYYQLYGDIQTALGLSSDEWNAAIESSVDRHIRELQEYVSNNVKTRPITMDPLYDPITRRIMESKTNAFYRDGNLTSYVETRQQMPSLGEIHLSVLRDVIMSKIEGTGMDDISGNPIATFGTARALNTNILSVKALVNALQRSTQVEGFTRYRVPSSTRGDARTSMQTDAIRPVEYVYKNANRRDNQQNLGVEDTMPRGYLTVELGVPIEGTDTETRTHVKLPWSFHEGDLFGRHSYRQSLHDEYTEWEKETEKVIRNVPINPAMPVQGFGALPF
tara:strand:- start:3775 stop:8178 length:4404 start_codon:yes stop_codon:yes gene_type:complete